MTMTLIPRTNKIVGGVDGSDGNSEDASCVDADFDNLWRRCPCDSDHDRDGNHGSGSGFDVGVNDCLDSELGNFRSTLSLMKTFPN